MNDADRKLQANIVPFGLRMQPELKAHIEDEAKKNNRSINSEIVHRLHTWDEALDKINYAEAQVQRRDEEILWLKAKIEQLEIKLEQEVVILPEDLIQKLIKDADLGHETLSHAAESRLREALRERAVTRRTSAKSGDYIAFIDERLEEISGALWELKGISGEGSDK